MRNKTSLKEKTSQHHMVDFLAFSRAQSNELKGTNAGITSPKNVMTETPVPQKPGSPEIHSVIVISAREVHVRPGY